MTFRPLAPVPAVSMSMVTSSSAAIDVLLNTAGVAAVADVFSVASMVSLVLRIEVPFLLMSTVTTPEDETVLTLAFGSGALVGFRVSA